MANKYKAPALIPVDKLHTFEGHPYKVKDDEEMENLIESIKAQGILTPLSVRPLEDTENEYEIISGHRRLHAAIKAGIKKVPAFIHSLDRFSAAIMVVDSNIYREHILPSEKAFAYKMKMDALSHQGTSSQVETKLRSDEMIAKDSGESRATVQRYIRLTKLIPGLLDLMDKGKIALSVGVELSYLDEDSQNTVLSMIEMNENTPSYSQSSRMHKQHKEGTLTGETIEEILTEEKANQKERISFSLNDLRTFFPENTSPGEIKESILKILETIKEEQTKAKEVRTKKKAREGEIAR